MSDSHLTAVKLGYEAGLNKGFAMAGAIERGNCAAYRELQDIAMGGRLLSTGHGIHIGVTLRVQMLSFLLRTSSFSFIVNGVYPMWGNDEQG